MSRFKYWFFEKTNPKYCEYRLFLEIRMTCTKIQIQIPSQKNCAGLTTKNESRQFLIPCSDVNRIPVRGSATTGSNGSQKGQGLGYKAGEVKLPIHCFPNSS